MLLDRVCRIQPLWRGVAILVLVGLSSACAESTSSVTTGPTPSKCQVALTGTSNVESIGGVGTITVTTQAECVWNASSSSGWISGLAPASGQGSGSIEFRAANNPNPAARDGEVVVNDARLRVTQQAAPATCSYTLAPATQTVANAGGTGSVTLTTTAGCTWSASSSATWLTLTGATSGTASGTVAFSAAANTGGERNATISVGNQQATVRQPGVGSASCEYTISPSAQSFTAAGGAGGPISVTTTAGCTWAARTTDTWITLSGNAGGSGNGSVTFAVMANTGAARTGTITIAGETFTVAQAASGPSSCTYSLSPTNISIAAAGGTSAPIAVTADAGCPWSATSTATWITVVTGASGSGNGTVTLALAANTATSARTGTVTIGGQTLTVNQEAATQVCVITITPSSQSVPYTAGTGSSITVSTAPTCAWTAASTAGWLTVITGASGTGNGTVTFRIDANDTAVARTGSLTIGGQTFTVNQAAAPCAYTLNPSSLSASPSGQNGASFEVQTLTGCTWTAASNASWIAVTAGGSGSGRGTVSINVAANQGGPRSGSVTITGQSPTTSTNFLVDQGAASCSTLANPTTISNLPASATAGQVISVTANLGSCTWTATSNAPWLTITEGASGTGTGIVRYNVGANSGIARTGTMTIAGQTITVNQVGCPYALSPTSQNHPLAGATLRYVTIVNSAACSWPWTAVSNVPWIRVDAPGAGTGAGFITYTIDPATAPRSGTLTIAGQTFTASQP